MADKNKPISMEEIAISNMYQIEAMIRLMENKGLLERTELLEEIQKIEIEQREKRKQN